MKQVKENNNKIVIRSVIPLTSSQLVLIKTELNQNFKVDYPIENVIDKNILGGLTISIGDLYIDASISNEINQLKKVLLE